jgi:hypothetical protein
MVRVLAGALGVLALCLASASAQERVEKKVIKERREVLPKGHKEVIGEVVRVNRGKGVMVVRVRNPRGKMVERTVRIHKATRFLGPEGKTVEITHFRAGHPVRIVEGPGGKVTEIRHRVVREKREEKRR